MSSLFKGVRKIFKKIIKAVKKLAPIILAVGAIVFTGGAALGLSFAAGGWSSAAATVGSTLGGSGLLGSVLTGAITQAGTSALIGGGIAAVTGGSFREGAKAGAAVGAVTGGLFGGISYAKGAGVSKPGMIDEGGATGTPSSVTTTPLPEQAGVNYQTGAGQAVDAAGNVIPAAGGSGGGLFKNIGGFIKDNPEVSAGLISGIGQGLLAGSEADDYRALQRERFALTAANYKGTDPGRNYSNFAPGTSELSPEERFDPKSYGSFEYRFDPKVGRIVKMPVGA